MNTDIFLRGYTMDWDTPESDSLHLEYSYGKNIWYTLNGGNGIYFPKSGSGQLINPRLKELPEGGFEVIAEDKKDSTLFIKCKTKDFITYTDEQLIMSSSTVMVDQTLGPNSPITVSEDIMKPLWALFGRPEPVTILPSTTLWLAQGSTLPESMDIPLTNGSTAKYHMDWGKFGNTPITVSQSITAYATEHRYQNPFIMNRADPFIYHHTDGNYYFTASYTDASNNLNGTYQYRKILLRRAASLDDLADNSGKYDEVCVFEREPLKNGASPHIWAPEIHFVNGSWYIYYTTTVSDSTPWDIRPHVMECKDKDPVTGTWTNLGLVKKDDDNDIAFTDFSLDHTVFEHNGELYMIWAQKCPVLSDLMIAKMSNPWTIKSPSVKITTPEYIWEKHGFKVCEGPSILKRNGRIFLIYSASGTDALYCLGMLTADDNADLLNPASWHKTPYPVFISSRANGQFGPGHNSFTTDSDGNDIMVYHARMEERYLADPGYQPLYDAGRNTSVMRIFWNPDGTPNLSVPNSCGPKAECYKELEVNIRIK